MTLEVYIPEQEQFDTWKDIDFIDEIGADININKKSSITSYNNKIYTVAIGNNKIYTKTYDDKWNTINVSSIDNTNNIAKVDLVAINKELYMLESRYEKITLYQFLDNSWKKITEINDTNGLNSYKKYNDELYLTKVDSSGKNIELYKLENNIFSSIGKYNSDNEFVGDPKIETINNKLYAINRTASGEIKIYKIENGKFVGITNEMNSNQYDVVSKENKIYFVLGSDYNNNKMQVIIFDGTNFETINTNIEYSFPQLMIAQENIYVLTMDQKASGKTIVYKFNEESKILEQVGLNVDNGADFNNISFTSLDNKIYVILKRMTDGTLAVKTKELEIAEKTLRQYLTEAGYNVTNEYVQGFYINETIAEIKSKLGNSRINIQNNQDIISTGVKFSYKGEEFTSILYGDIDGDGKVNSLDLLKMRQHLIKKIELTGANKKAAAIARNEQINSLDLLKLRRHLIKIEMIKQ